MSRPKQEPALELEAIRKAVAVLPATDIGKRNRALLLLAYALMARRSALVALDVENFDFHEDGSETVTFDRVKTRETSTNYLPADIVDFPAEEESEPKRIRKSKLQEQPFLQTVAVYRYATDS